MKAQTIDWDSVEAAMRRSVTGRGKDSDLDLCHRAHKKDPEKYGELNRRVRSEEFEAEKNRYRG